MRPFPCALLALALATPGAHAQARSVAVLYFDNNTGDRQLDVLQKGFADMMVTDLSAVDGVQVVEREKLEKLIFELKLQRTGFFDPATTQKLGKGVGARYAVAGAFAAVDPVLRIDARLVEVSTGKVVLADKVSGDKSKLFELQQLLVSKLAEAMNAKLGLAAAGRRTRVPDVAALVAYSRGIDLADQGKLDEASKALAELVKRAPAFGLARQRRDELLKRLREAASRRKEILDEGAQELARAAKAYLASHRLDALDEQEARAYLAYRVLEGRTLVRELKAHLSRREGTRVVLRGHEGPSFELMRAIAASQRKLVDEAQRFSSKHTRQVGAVAYLDSSLPLPPDDQRRSREAGFGAPSLGRSPRLALAEFLLLGFCEDSESGRLMMAPTLSDVDPKLAAEGFLLLEEAFFEADAQVQAQPHLEYAAIQVLDTHAEALLRKGRSEEAIGRWQKILDTYPTTTQYGRFEKRIQEELGLGHTAAKKDALAFSAFVKDCDDLSIIRALGSVMHQRVLTTGADGIRLTVEEVEKSCKGHARMKRRWDSVYSNAGLYAATIEDCATFQQMFDKYQAAGGSLEHREAYTRNYAPHCAP